MTTDTSHARPWPLLILLLALLVVPLVYLFVYVGGFDRLAEARQPRGPAYAFQAPKLGGGEIALADYRGRPVVLNFWASWCPPCRAEAPDFQRVWQAYQSQGIVFLGVDVSDGEAAALAYVRDYGITYPSVVDTRNDISTAYGATSLPTTVFINQDGLVVGKRVGPMSEGQLVARVEELLR